MNSPLATEADVRRHIMIKRAGYDLPDEWADAMLAALDAGAGPDYPALLEAAMFPDPPAVVYHTAPQCERAVIAMAGLKMCQPGQGGNWAPREGTLCVMLQASQPPGVYVTPEPDVRGVWSHWPSWDVWEVTRGSLSWRHDRLNPGCWSLSEDVPPAAVRLEGSYGGRSS